ncbi:hypothetical protein BZG36_03980 [Bifiguratus adelaidae]|uniref:Uncharacterized protein n=1 Tax=Bifiguratus adelaidae TaxID=1938954 RepID=A0A261XXC7_9FUNG|nr:hypothetical protein BZG36_03980 [Bifiguratus adelaidae]
MLVALLLCVLPGALAALGQACNPQLSHLDQASMTYMDACLDPTLSCQPQGNSTTTGTCVYKVCANTDYIKNWPTNVQFPVRCNGTQYCPDNGLGCQPLIPTGSRCEYARDDECQGADGKGLNAICLNYVCNVKAAALGAPCELDEFTYIYYYRSDSGYQQIVQRDNCTTNTYCNAQFNVSHTGTCVPAFADGQACTQDRMCMSQNCNNDGAGGPGVCANPPDAFKVVPLWTWATIGAAIIVFMIIVLLGLWLLHRFQSRREHNKIKLFYEQQELFKQQNNINERGSIYLSTPSMVDLGGKRHSMSSLSLSSNNPRSQIRSPGSNSSSIFRYSTAGADLSPGHPMLGSRLSSASIGAESSGYEDDDAQARPRFRSQGSLGNNSERGLLQTNRKSYL